jgi:hypothetical protein
MEIQFDLAGDPEGGRVSNYLLEKSRIIYQTPGESNFHSLSILFTLFQGNFHIFYQLLNSNDSSLSSELCLTTPEYFHYLNQSRCYTVDGINDAEEWKDTTKAMQTMGFTPDEQKEIFRILAGILYLGNIHFTNDAKDQAQIADQQSTRYEKKFFSLFSQWWKILPTSSRQILTVPAKLCVSAQFLLVLKVVLLVYRLMLVLNLLMGYWEPWESELMYIY